MAEDESEDWTQTLLSKIPYTAPNPKTDPPVRERDLVLGQFMDAWSQVEWELRSLLQVLSQAPHQVAAPMAAAIPDNGRLGELLQVLGRIYLEDDDCKELDEIVDYLKILNRYRNSIVHGHWGLTNNREQKVVNGVVYDFMWIRIYIFIDKTKEFNAALGRDEKAHDQYVFTVDRLKVRSQKAVAFAGRLEEFSGRIKSRLRKL